MTADIVEQARQLPPPTVREIINELDNPTELITYCRHKPSGERTQPLELWIAALHTWLHCDGSLSQTALHGSTRYHGLNRMRIAQAVKRWRKVNP